MRHTPDSDWPGLAWIGPNMKRPSSAHNRVKLACSSGEQASPRAPPRPMAAGDRNNHTHTMHVRCFWAKHSFLVDHAETQNKRTMPILMCCTVEGHPGGTLQHPSHPVPGGVNSARGQHKWALRDGHGPGGAGRAFCRWGAGYCGTFTHIERGNYPKYAYGHARNTYYLPIRLLSSEVTTLHTPGRSTPGLVTMIGYMLIQCIPCHACGTLGMTL